LTRPILFEITQSEEEEEEEEKIRAQGEEECRHERHLGTDQSP
jgi:hypothetical protein